MDVHDLARRRARISLFVSQLDVTLPYAEPEISEGFRCLPRAEIHVRLYATFQGERAQVIQANTSTIRAAPADADGSGDLGGVRFYGHGELVNCGLASSREKRLWASTTGAISTVVTCPFSTTTRPSITV